MEFLTMAVQGELKVFGLERVHDQKRGLTWTEVEQRNFENLELERASRGDTPLTSDKAELHFPGLASSGTLLEAVSTLDVTFVV